MTILTADSTECKNTFDTITQAFLKTDGLPFAQVLSPESIQQAFLDENALFAQNDIYSTQIVLWAFLAQTLRDGKGAACASAVADITNYMTHTSQLPPSISTGDYCRARAKLSLPALDRLVGDAAAGLESQAQPSWLWKGLHPKLADGFTFTMLDTPENQQAFPQMKTQTAGVGFPIARACVVLSLSTGCVCKSAIGPYQGKETGETALLRQMLDAFEENDVIVFDRYYCSFMMLALFSLRKVHVCVRLHQRRHSDLSHRRRLGPGDHLVTWTRPPKPAWMTQEQYEQIPQTLTLREVKFDVTVPGRRTQTLTVVTTLIDPQQYTPEDIAALYGFRWNAELDIRQIKQTLNLDHVCCKTPEMVRRHMLVTLLAYNLIRKVMATSAAIHGKQPRQLGFTLACQMILSSYLTLSTGLCPNPHQQYQVMLRNIAANEVGNRPGRIEPRVLKRRTQHYPLMQRPREELREELRRA